MKWWLKLELASILFYSDSGYCFLGNIRLAGLLYDQGNRFLQRGFKVK